MKRLLLFAFALLLVMVSCDRYAKYEPMFYPIDSVSRAHPDSALRLLEALS